MDGLSRRRFLTVSAAAAAYGYLSASVARALGGRSSRHSRRVGNTRSSIPWQQSSPAATGTYAQVGAVRADSLVEVEIVNGDVVEHTLVMPLAGFPKGWVPQVGDLVVPNYRVVPNHGGSSSLHAWPFTNAFQTTREQLQSAVQAPGTPQKIDGQVVVAQKATEIQPPDSSGGEGVYWVVSNTKGKPGQIFAARAA